MTMGIAAAERCDDFGWHPRGQIDPSLVAEIAQHPRFGMGHAWSRSAGYNLTKAPKRTYLVLTVEGGFEFTVDGAPVTTGPGSLIMLDGQAPTTARTLTDTARFVWHFEPTFLRPGLSRFEFGEPIATAGSSMRALTAMTNALLRSPAPATETTRRHLSLAFENLLAGVLEERGSLDPGASPHREGLFMAALAAIESRFRDPAFTVAGLAKELSVSVRALHDTFNDMGSTPRREIERRRLTEIGQLSTIDSLSPAELADRAGFTSARQLTRALSRGTSEPSAPPR